MGQAPQNHAGIIEAYVVAYTTANGEPPPFRVIYERGWVEFRSRHSSYVSSRRRLSALAAMTAVLEARSKPLPSSPTPASLNATSFWGA